MTGIKLLEAPSWVSRDRPGARKAVLRSGGGNNRRWKLIPSGGSRDGVSSQGIKLTEKEMRYISIFEAYTGAAVRDCIEDENQLIFIVNKGDMPKSIGKRDSRIQELAELFKKRLKVIEHSDDAAEFIINALKPAQVRQVRISEKPNGKSIAVALVDPSDKGMTIGKGGKNIELIRQIVKRHHNIDHIIVK